MEKYLFNDGTSEIREVQSAEELWALVQSSTDPTKVRIWVFSTSQWISYSDFSKRIFSGNKSFNLPVPPALATIKAVQLNGHRKLLTLKSNKRWLKKFLLFISAGLAIFLVYNFTKIKWEKTGSLDINASRPGKQSTGKC